MNRAFPDLITALSSRGFTDEYFQALRYQTNLQEKGDRMIGAVSTAKGDGQLTDACERKHPVCNPFCYLNNLE